MARHDARRQEQRASPACPRPRARPAHRDRVVAMQPEFATIKRGIAVFEAMTVRVPGVDRLAPLLTAPALAPPTAAARAPA